MQITRHEVGEGAYGVALSADGSAWTTLVDQGVLVRVRPDGKTNRLRLHDHDSRPMVLATDNDDAVWFSRGDGQIGRVDASGDLSSRPALTPTGSPYGLCVGPDRTIWYTLLTADRIGRIGADGDIKEFPLAEGSFPSLITTGPDGALWFTLNQANAIGRSTTAGEVTTFPLPTEGAGAVGIHGACDSVWFTEILAGQIGRIDPTGRIEEFPLPDRSSRPHAVVSTPDGGCWVSLWAGNAVIRLDRDARVMDDVPLADDTEPHGMALAADGSLWVALESGALLHLENDAD